MYPLLLVLALLLPFELTRPLFTVGPLQITSVELPLYALVALSALRRDAWRPSAWTPLHWAALVWAGAHLLSAAAAESDRSLAFRFAARMSVGAALVFPVSAATRPEGRAARVLQAVVAGAVLSAALGLAEALFPAAASLMASFKTVTARVAETVRAGGPFQYPNPAALYWGAAVPAVLALGASPGQDTGRRYRLLAIAGGLVLLTAVAATGSRGGTLATAVVLGLLAAVPALRLRRPALVAIAGLALAVLVVAVTRQTLMLRNPGLAGEVPWFAGRFEALDPPPEIGAGQETRLRVRMSNVGGLAWETTGPMPVGLSAQWLEAGGRVAHEEPVTAIEQTLAPGATHLVQVTLTAPEPPGRYTLRFQLVGGSTTFAPAAASGEVSITVVAASTSARRAWPPVRPVQGQATRLELWHAGGRMWRERPLLGVGPDNFRRLYGAHLGPRTLDDRVNANSLYLETLANLGLVGAASLVLLFVAMAQVALRAWRSEHGPERLVVVASGAALVAFALHGMVDSVLPATPLYGLFWIHAGLLAGLSRGGRGRGGHPTRRFW